MLGRTPSELEETLGAQDWDLLLRFHGECDLPDGFLVTGVLGSLIANILGGRTKPGDFAPYYREPRPTGPAPGPGPGPGPRGGPLAAAFQFLKEVVPHAERPPQPS